MRPRLRGLVLDSRGLRHKEAYGLYRLTDVPTLTTINSGAKASIIEFDPKARCLACIGGSYFKQANFVRSDFINHDVTRVVVLGVEKQPRIRFCNTRSNHFVYPC